MKFKEKIKELIGFYHWIPFYIGKKCMKDTAISIKDNMIEISKRCYKKTDYLLTYGLYPLKAEMVNESIKMDTRDSCIVIQGPIIKDFTIESIKLYMRLFNTTIIVSTWSTTDNNLLREIEDIGAVLVLCTEPEVPGRLNINYQIVNTLAGIRKAKELGFKYACKIRSDQRIYHPNMINCFEGLLDAFPVDKSIRNQNSRIIVTTMSNGTMFYPFYISDFLFFGRVEELINLFNIDQDTRSKGNAVKGLSKKQYAEQYLAPEIIFARHYARFTGQDNNCTVLAYWNFMRKSLISIGKNEINLIWDREAFTEKYDLSRFYGTYAIKEPHGQKFKYNFDFPNWIALYSGKLIYDSKYEEYSHFIM